MSGGGAEGLARGRGRGAFWSAFAVAAAGLACTVALLGLLVWPGLSSARAAETADGARAFAVPAGGTRGAASASVTPAAGWSVRAVGDGLVLHSPDRVLEVGLSAVPGAEAEAVLSEAAGDAPVLNERIASGLELRHVTVDEGFVGVLDTGDGTVLIEARLDPPADFADYRPALAGLVEALEAP